MSFDQLVVNPPKSQHRLSRYRALALELWLALGLLTYGCGSAGSGGQKPFIQPPSIISQPANTVVAVSCGWAFSESGLPANVSGLYEAQVVTAAFATLSAAATNLAQAGYVITALGGNGTDGFVLVGTRVKGNTAARPVLVGTAGSQE